MVDIQTIMASNQPPDIMVVTETKLKSQPRQQWLHRLFKGYTIKHTTHPQVSKAGVLLAVSQALAELGELKLQPTPPELNGFLVHATLHRPNSTPLHLVAVYCPHQLPIREEIYKHITQSVTTARAANDQMLITGGFNAVQQKRR
jgi:exonuclease III